MCYVPLLHIFAMANSKGIPRDPEKKARSQIGIFSIIMVLLVTLLMLLEAMAGTAPVQSINPAVTANIQPAPTMNTNVSWSVFHSGWNPLEYSNGSANLTLNADTSTTYANPISVNPADVAMNGTLQNDKVAGTVWNAGKPTGSGTVNGGAVATTANVSIGNINTPSITINGSEAAANGGATLAQFTSTIPITSLPSNNIQYDYLTIGMQLTGPKLTGVHTQLNLYNGSVVTQPSEYVIDPGQTIYMSVNFAQLNTFNGGKGFNLTGSQAATAFDATPYMVIPKAPSTDTWTLNVFAYALTTYPISLGENATGSPQTEIHGSAALAQFNPTSAASVYNNGYSIALSQPMQNLTTQQSAVSSGSYVEQVEYQGQFNLPTAPDLSYGSANLTEQFNVPTAQTQVLDINGVSYLNAISGKNGTVQLLSSVNPNGQTQFLQIVDYTQSQWTSISSPPGIFTIQGIEYYWEEFIIAILAVVGIGAGAASKHASSLRKVK